MEKSAKPTLLNPETTSGATTEVQVQNQALHLLENYRQCYSEFIESLELEFSEIPMINENEMMLIKYGVPLLGVDAEPLASYMLQNFGIKSSQEAIMWENCKALLRSTRQPERFWMPVAPWFMQWYLSLDIWHIDINRFVRDLSFREISDRDRFLYRGESKEYPYPARSTLSRHWDTTDANVLKSIIKNSEGDTRRQSFVEDKEDIQGTLQHLGGKTNSIDFSGNLWVALYFACESDLDEDGIIWGYGGTRNINEIIVRRPNLNDQTARNRAAYQVGWLIEPDGGFVPKELLHRIATVPKELKPILLEFLRGAGIEKNTLFPDIHRVIQDGQDTIPPEALVGMFAERLRKGDVNWLFANTNQMLHSDKSDTVRRRSCLYFRGLASAISGDLPSARKDLIDARDLFNTEDVPKALQTNLMVVQSSLISRDVSRIKRKLDFDASDSGWWSKSLKGYTFKGTF